MQDRGWDIHPDGHCYHPSGLDAYLSGDFTPQGARKLAGPYSSSLASVRSSEATVRSAMRTLVRQLEDEVFSSEEFVVWGLIGSNPLRCSSRIEVMGVKLPFLSNPTLRTALWEEYDADQRAIVHAKEWNIDHSRSIATHRVGLEFAYHEERDSVFVGCRPCGSSEIGMISELIPEPLLEILAEQGYAGLTNFQPARHFQKLVFESSLVA